MILLNSKNYTSGNKDTWWYNISSPRKLTAQDSIVLNLWDTENKNIMREVTLDLGSNNWLKRIQTASTHYYEEREICKIHIHRNQITGKYILYFGRKENGIYPI